MTNHLKQFVPFSFSRVPRGIVLKNYYLFHKDVMEAIALAPMDTIMEWILESDDLFIQDFIFSYGLDCHVDLNLTDVRRNPRLALEHCLNQLGGRRLESSGSSGRRLESSGSSGRRLESSGSSGRRSASSNFRHVLPHLSTLLRYQTYRLYTEYLTEWLQNKYTKQYLRNHYPIYINDILTLAYTYQVWDASIQTSQGKFYVQRKCKPYTNVDICIPVMLMVFMDTLDHVLPKCLLELCLDFTLELNVGESKYAHPRMLWTTHCNEY